MIKTKTIWKIPLLVIICALAGWALLSIVYCIPVGRMQEHAKDSAYLFGAEYAETGGYKELTGDLGSTPDYLSDAVMLLTAAYDSPHPAWKAALLVELEGVEDHLAHESIVLLASDEADTLETSVKEYDRYWEGFLVFIKPLFFLFGYGKLRHIQIILHMGLFTLLQLMLFQYKRTLCLPFLITYVFLHPPVLMLCMFYSCATLNAMATMIVILCLYAKRGADAAGSMDFWCLFFTFTGCTAIYFDFLSCPLLTLGLPLLLWTALYRTNKVRTDMIRIIGLSACWTIGYGGMWAMKWVIISLFTEKNIMAEVWSQIKTRSDVTAFSYADVLSRNLFSSGIGVYLLLMVALAVVAGVALSLKHMERTAPYLFIGCYPFVWYAALQEHSHVHAHYTYRLLSITVFAFLAILVNELHALRMRKKGDQTG